jgi:hypothetical protein
MIPLILFVIQSEIAIASQIRLKTYIFKLSIKNRAELIPALTSAIHGTDILVPSRVCSVSHLNTRVDTLLDAKAHHI